MSVIIIRPTFIHIINVNQSIITRTIMSNRRGGLGLSKARLDRVVASLDWRVLFSFASVWNLPDFASDHRPILLNTNEEPSG